MKKEVLVFMLVLAITFIAGCSTQRVPEVDPFKGWSNSLPLYYSEKGADDITKAALEKNSVEECATVMTEPISIEKTKIYLACKTMVTKQEAFMKKDYEKCKEFYSGDDSKEYEECIAPIVAYSAISLNDNSYCGKYLNNERLIELCEVDYEQFA